MRQWRNGVGNAPRHYAGTRSATGCALSRTRSLTAAAIAVAMMATVTITSLLPTYSAKADTAEAGICTPKPISLGDNVGDLTVDSGVATYVGGNMYVGANNHNYTDLSSSQKIDKSYAVEAEGLTLVNGKLATNGVKNSWGNKGFRFGVVGFGAQFRPKSGSDVLVVAGNSTSNTSNSTGSMWDARNKSVSALGGFDNGSTGRAFVQNTDSGTWYSARIKGDTSWHLNADNSSESNAGRSVWDATASTDAATGTNVHYDNTIGLSNVTLNGATKDYSTFYADNVLGLSKQLVGLQKSEGVHVADAEVSTAAANSAYVRHHYGYESAIKISYTFKFSGGEDTSNAEKLITFEGDADANGKGSAMQVFNVTAEQLSSENYRGVDFAFTNIPDDASVVVNVSGPNIDFHNGWRFWWNGTEIGDDYSKAAEDMQKNLYSAAAQKIMWNFKEATQVTIRGGVANESTGELDGNKEAKSTDDDPAAAMLGSILIPNGNFEDHVTTNGRVYVGGDFSMYNPTAIPYVNNNGGWEGRTASVINMDQERHNLPWNGTFNSSCAVIQINKVDSSKNALAGTTWGVFMNYADAKAGTAANALRVVKDGGAFDLDDTDNGTIQIGSLNPNATYYLKEIASASGYQVSDKVYQITAGAGGSTAQDVKESSDGTTWTAVAGNWIVNEKKGASLEWSKVDGPDSNKVLSGSEWQLTTSDGQTAYQITDSTKDVTSVEIYYNGNVPSETITMTEGIPFDLTASVFGNGNKTDGVPQGVAWTATGSVVVDDNGKVTAVNDGDGTVTACSLAATNICATVNVTVPAGTIIKPTPKNSTTFYFKAEGYTSGNTKLHYSFTPDDTSSWKDAEMTTAEGCTGYLTVTIDNPELKAVTYLFFKGADSSSSDWYHKNNSSSENFATDANQTVTTVENYAAMSTAPSGCSAGGGSGSGGSTTTGTVTITGDSVVSLGKTITLTATPTPSPDTVTWYSGNTSVASVAAGSGTTATVTGLKAGTTTITAKTSSGATASVTVTVKDDSTVGVYFKKSAVNSEWSNYYLHYQKTANYWPAVKMKDACNSAYMVAYIPKADAHKGYGFLFRDSMDIETGNWYGANGENTSGGNFTFWNDGVGMHIESNSDKGEGVPSGCQATQSAAKMKARVSTAVLRSDKIRTVAINESDGSNADASTTVYACGDPKGKCDMDTRAGYFKVIDLADGTYTLTETVAPNGYTAGGPYTVRIANGVVAITNASGNAIAGNEIPNARNTGAILWNKVSSDPQNDKKLGNSEWKLTKTESFSWNANGAAQYTKIAAEQQPSVTIADCKLGKGNTCSASDGQSFYDVDPVEGQFKLEGLEWGTYTLVETRAPDGYDVDSTVRTFTFGPVTGSDGAGQWNSNSVVAATGNTTGAFTTSDKDYDSSVFTFTVGNIKNKPGVILPGTGGTGNSWIYAAALVAALIGVVAAGMALKVRRRQ